MLSWFFLRLWRCWLLRWAIPHIIHHSHPFSITQFKWTCYRDLRRDRTIFLVCGCGRIFSTPTRTDKSSSRIFSALLALLFSKILKLYRKDFNLSHIVPYLQKVDPCPPKYPNKSHFSYLPQQSSVFADYSHKVIMLSYNLAADGSQSLGSKGLERTRHGLNQENF